MPRLEERDLRSLERRSMYSIFAPLDPHERLPRELFLEARRHRTYSWRGLIWVLWPPALFSVVIIADWTNFNGILAVGLLAATLLGFWAFALSGRQR